MNITPTPVNVHPGSAYLVVGHSKDTDGNDLLVRDVAFTPADTDVTSIVNDENTEDASVKIATKDAEVGATAQITGTANGANADFTPNGKKYKGVFDLTVVDKDEVLEPFFAVWTEVAA